MRPSALKAGEENISNEGWEESSRYLVGCDMVLSVSEDTQEVEELMDKIKGPAIFIQVGLSEITRMFFHY